MNELIFDQRIHFISKEYKFLLSERGWYYHKYVVVVFVVVLVGRETFNRDECAIGGATFQ